MATRFYLPSSGGAAVAPAYDAAWQVTSAANRYGTSTTKGGTPLALRSTGNNLAPDDNCLAAQFVSAPLAAGTIAGTVKGQIVTREATADTNAMAQIVIRVVSEDGGTVRGTLVAAHSEALSSEYSVSFGSRKFPLAALSPLALNSVDAQEGDRLVIEVGSRVTGAGGSPATSLRVQDDQASDLPEDETSTGFNPWIEFSADLSFQGGASPAATPKGGMSMGIGVEV